jgi:hypothetical protein
MNTNQKSDSNFKTNAVITEEWNGGYKLEVELTPQEDLKKWELDFDLPQAYEIRNAYGVDIADNDDGSYTITGQNDQVNLKKEQSIEPILIIDGKGMENPLPEFMSMNSSGMEITKMNSSTKKKSKNMFEADSEIVDSWDGGYKLEVELTAKSDLNDWQVNFDLPYNIRAAYGVDLTDKGKGSYSIDGQSDWVNMKKGQSIKPIFIIDDDGMKDLIPEFDESVKSGDKSRKEDNKSEPKMEDGSEFVSTEQKGKFAYGEALQRNFLFFEANRSGDLPKDNRIEWRKDSTLDDGSDVGVDLEGGYFDAGDHIKFIQPMTFSSTMLAWGGIDYQEAYAKSGQLDELRDAVKWGTDWFLKAHEMDDSGNTSRLWVQVGDGTAHDHWVGAQEITELTDRKSYFIDAERPGSDAAAGTASALASASMLFRDVDEAYADELIKNAIALYDFAEQYQGKYSDSVPEVSPFYTSWSGYYDELSLGAAWLYKATGEEKYLTKAEDYFKDNVGALGDWTYAADDHSYGAAMILAKESDDGFFKEEYKKWVDIWIDEKGGINDTPKGFAIRTKWASIPINMSTSFAAEWYNDNIEENPEYSEFATRQVDYVLGDNPDKYSFLIGFGENYPVRPHHRGSAGSQNLNGSDTPNDHILHGAIVGGPSKPNIDSHNDRRDDFRTNEVGTGYNAPFAGAAIQQYDNFGGDPLSQSELDMLEGIDANGVGF